MSVESSVARYLEVIEMAGGTRKAAVEVIGESVSDTLVGLFDFSAWDKWREKRRRDPGSFETFDDFYDDREWSGGNCGVREEDWPNLREVHLASDQLRHAKCTVEALATVAKKFDIPFDIDMVTTAASKFSIDHPNWDASTC